MVHELAALLAFVLAAVALLPLGRARRRWPVALAGLFGLAVIAWMVLDTPEAVAGVVQRGFVLVVFGTPVLLATPRHTESAAYFSPSAAGAAGSDSARNVAVRAASSASPIARGRAVQRGERAEKAAVGLVRPRHRPEALPPVAAQLVEPAVVAGAGVGVAGDRLARGQRPLGERRPRQRRRRVRRGHLGRVRATVERGGGRVGRQQGGVGPEQVAVQRHAAHPAASRISLPMWHGDVDTSATRVGAATMNREQAEKVHIRRGLHRRARPERRQHPEGAQALRGRRGPVLERRPRCSTASTRCAPASSPAPASRGDRILGAILFEDTMDRQIEGRDTGDYLWSVKNVVPFLKVDKGLADEADGAQVMKPMPGPRRRCSRAPSRRACSARRCAR